MARLVLLSFKDNGNAEDFVRLLVEPEKAANELATLGAFADDANVEWVIGRPVNACVCGSQRQPAGGRGRTRGTRRSSKRETSGWSKGKKYGWWIHPVQGCGRVSRMVFERFVPNLTGGAYDLLPEILGDPDRVPNDIRQFGWGGE